VKVYVYVSGYPETTGDVRLPSTTGIPRVFFTDLALNFLVGRVCMGPSSSQYFLQRLQV